MSMQRTMLDFPRNEAGLVDKFLGTAWDAVYNIYLNLDEILRADEEAAAAKASAEAAKASELAAKLSEENAEASAIAAAQSAAETAAGVSEAIAARDFAEAAAINALAYLELVQAGVIQVNGDRVVVEQLAQETAEYAEQVGPIRADLADQNDPTKGSNLLGHDSQTVADALNKVRVLPTYAALRNYLGTATRVTVQQSNGVGVFSVIPGDTTSVETTGLLFVDGKGRRWLREYQGNPLLPWFKETPGIADSIAFTYAKSLNIPITVPAGNYVLPADIEGKWDIRWGAIFTGAGQAKPQTGGFWTDIDAGARIFRNSGRMALGIAAAISGKSDPGADKTWVGYSSGGLMSYLESRSLLTAFSENGVIAGAFASKSSDQNPAIGGPCIGVGAFVRNDKAGSSSWALYATAVKDNDSVKATHGAEIDVANRGLVVDIHPYSITADGQTVSCWLRSGGETAESGQAVNPASAAMGIVGSVSSNAKAKFRKGIVFSADAIDVEESTGHSPAIVLARNQKIEWIRDGSGSKGGEIRSDATNSVNRVNAVFTNSGLGFFSLTDTGAETETVRITGIPTAVNFIELRGSATGSTAAIQVGGTDSIRNLALQGGGVGGAVMLRDGAGAERIRANTTGIGFFGSAPVAKPAVSGSRAANVALASLLDQLSALGLITNSTSA